MRKGIKSEEGRLTFGSASIFTHRHSLSLSVACSFCWRMHRTVCMQRCMYMLILLYALAHVVSHRWPHMKMHVWLTFFFLPTVLHAHTSIPFSYSKCSLNTICRVVLNYSEAGTGSVKVVFKMLKGRIYLRSIFLLPALLVCIYKLSFETTRARNLMFVFERKAWKASGWSSNFRSWDFWENPYPCSHKSTDKIANIGNINGSRDYRRDGQGLSTPMFLPLCFLTLSRIGLPDPAVGRGGKNLSLFTEYLCSWDSYHCARTVLVVRQ